MLDTKNYTMKRPKDGYNSAEERAMSQWSDVSEYEVFFKNKKIGLIFKNTSGYDGDWTWIIDFDGLDRKPRGSSERRKDALDDLIYEHQKIRRNS